MAASKGSVLITGANGGLGIAIVKQVVSQPELANYHGLYTVRDAESAPALRPVLAGYPSHQHDILLLDLTNIDSIRQAAEAINRRVSAREIPPIRALILNAGYQNLSTQTWGADGLDPTFAVNYLGHWLLTLLLLKSIEKSSGRIVVVGSQVHDPHSRLNTMIRFQNPFADDTLIRDQHTFEAIARGAWNPISEDPSWRSGYRRYGAAKLCAMMMMLNLQRRMSQDVALSQVCILAVDPGYMSTGLQRHAHWFVRVVIFQILFPISAWLVPGGPIRSPNTSASHVLRAAFDSGPGIGELPKGLYFDGIEPAETSMESRDTSKQDWVWKGSVNLTNLRQGDTVLGNWR
ncbi:putative short-chain dehydrogenase [Xylaria castorea]|nr:putative short-chain dehydrogenase [Xylaria castorea]